MVSQRQRLFPAAPRSAVPPTDNVVLVDGTLPDEHVRVTIRSRAQGPSPRRRRRGTSSRHPTASRPPCVHQREGCGGYQSNDVAPAAQPRHKRTLIDRARVAPDCSPLRPRPCTRRSRCRPRATEHRAGARRERPARSGRHHVHHPVPIAHCLVAHPLVDDILQHGSLRQGRERSRCSGAAPASGACPDPECARSMLPTTCGPVPVRYVHEIDRAAASFRVSARLVFQTRPDGADALAAPRARCGRARAIRGATCTPVSVCSVRCSTRRGALVSVERSRSAVRDARHNLRDPRPRGSSAPTSNASAPGARRGRDRRPEPVGLVARLRVIRV